ncbi:unnamed protein product [Amoebophrya sp. A120]|nr:unnamed protein product [Amoebophrya sp. A120]|eukprot:GSA120T00022312001.1
MQALARSRGRSARSGLAACRECLILFFPNTQNYGGRSSTPTGGGCGFRRAFHERPHPRWSRPTPASAEQHFGGDGAFAGRTSRKSVVAPPPQPLAPAQAAWKLAGTQAAAATNERGNGASGVAASWPRTCPAGRLSFYKATYRAPRCMSALVGPRSSKRGARPQSEWRFFGRARHYL